MYSYLRIDDTNSPGGQPAPPAGALISLRSSPKSIICFLGVVWPAAMLLARPLRWRICSSASSRDMVALGVNVAGLGIAASGTEIVVALATCTV